MRLFILEPEIVFAGRVNMPSGATYPIRTITYDGVTTGSSGNIKDGMTVLLGSTAGADDYGRTRALSADGSTITIGYSSRGTHDGEVEIVDNAYITVLSDFRVWAKIPIITADDPPSIYKDGAVGPSTYNTNTVPVANTGPGTAGNVDAGTGLLRVSFDGSSSFATAPSASISSYAWSVLGSGSTVISGATSSTFVVDFTAGFYWVTLQVTDSNGTIHVARCPVYARSSNPLADETISAFEIESHRITPQGQQLSIRILEDIPASTYPDGTLVILYDGEPSSATDRSHIVFIGWIDTDDAQIEATRTGTLKGTVINCLDVAGRLDKLPGFPQEVQHAASPSTWMEMNAPNMDRYLHYLLMWHSTALEVADFTWSGTTTTYPFVILGSDGESLFDQVSRRANALVPDYHFVCNRKGQLRVKVDPMLQDSGSRTATVQTTLTEALWSDIRYTHQRPPRIHWHRANAIKASNSVIEALFCIAPGEAPGQGEMAQDHGEQLAVDQTGLNSCEGHRYARHNAPQGYFSITLAQGDDLGIEPADMTWVALTVSSATAAQRGLALSAARGLVREMNIRYQYERTGTVKTVDLIWERETEGLPAVTVIPPVATELPTGDDDDDWWDDDYWDEDPTDTPGTGTVYVVVDEVLGRTNDFGSTSPSWTDIAPGSTATIGDFILDPWAPETTGYLATDLGLYKSTDLDQASPSWTLVLSAANAASGVGGSDFQCPAKVLGSPTNQDYIALFFQSQISSVYNVCVAYTEDGGSSWDYAVVTSTALASGTDCLGGLRGWRGAADIVSHVVGSSLRLYCLIHHSSASVVLYRSDDKGATWSDVNTLGSNSPAGAGCIHCPHHSNADGNTVWFSTHAWKGWKSTDGGSTETEMPGPTKVRRTGFETAPTDSQRVVHWRTNNTMWVSTNGGTSWTQKFAAGLSGTIHATSGFPFDTGQYYALTTDGIFLSTDGGNTFVDKTGDWATGFTFCADEIGVIVPLWTE